MAISFDNYTLYNGPGGESTMTQAVTVTGSNTFLFVDVRFQATTDQVTGVTCNGVAMTKLQFLNVGIAGNDGNTVFYLFGATTGNVVASLGTAVGSNLRIASYAGVSNAGLDSSGNFNAGAPATTLSISLTSVADNSWMVGMMRNQAGAFTMTSGTDRSASDAVIIADSNGPIHPAGSATLSGTHTIHYDAAIAVTIAPALTTTAVTPKTTLALLGVG